MSKAHNISLIVSLLTHTYSHILRDMYSCTYTAAFNENGVIFYAFSHRKTQCLTLICSNSSSLLHWKMMTFVAQYHAKKEKHFILISFCCGSWDRILWNIKLWFSVIRYLITSPWRHNFTWNYMPMSNYVLSFKVMWPLQLCFCLWTSLSEKKNKNEQYQEVFAL